LDTKAESEVVEFTTYRTYGYAGAQSNGTHFRGCFCRGRVASKSEGRVSAPLNVHLTSLCDSSEQYVFLLGILLDVILTSQVGG
jgi:hypothetical protein